MVPKVFPVIVTRRTEITTNKLCRLATVLPYTAVHEVTLVRARITPEPYHGRSTLRNIASYTSVLSGHMLCTKRKCLKWPDREVYC